MTPSHVRRTRDEYAKVHLRYFQVPHAHRMLRSSSRPAPPRLSFLRHSRPILPCNSGPAAHCGRAGGGPGFLRQAPPIFHGQAWQDRKLKTALAVAVVLYERGVLTCYPFEEPNYHHPIAFHWFVFCSCAHGVYRNAGATCTDPR